MLSKMRGMVAYSVEIGECGIDPAHDYFCDFEGGLYVRFFFMESFLFTCEGKRGEVPRKELPSGWWGTY